MPNRGKGVRLWLRPGRTRGKSVEKPVWIIRDGPKQISTGLGKGQFAEAKEALDRYLTEKYRPERFGGGDPLRTSIADVIGLYAQDIAPGHARPGETGRRLECLLDHFGDKTLKQITKSECIRYAKVRVSQSAARRELEDLRSAIRHYFSGELLSITVNVWLPERSQPRPEWLTRSQAAKLLWLAYRKRQALPKGGVAYPARHIARFILMGLYTGTRSATICGTAIRPTIGSAFVDLDANLYHRRPAKDAETIKRRPTVRIPRRLRAHLERWQRRDLCATHVVEYQGEPVKRVTKAFARLVKEAGLTGVSPHTLRHTAITWAMQRGAPIEEASDFFGVTPEEMRRTYLHHHPDYQDGVLKAIG